MVINIGECAWHYCAVTALFLAERCGSATKGAYTYLPLVCQWQPHFLSYFQWPFKFLPFSFVVRVCVCQWLACLWHAGEGSKSSRTSCWTTKPPRVSSQGWQVEGLHYSTGKHPAFTQVSSMMLLYGKVRIVCFSPCASNTNINRSSLKFKWHCFVWLPHFGFYLAVDSLVWWSSLTKLQRFSATETLTTDMEPETLAVAF